MGFLDHSTNNIIIDAVLTDRGRELLAANDGSFRVVRYAFGDDEVDYSVIKKYGRTIGKEKIEKNTPVFEAQTMANLALRHPLASYSDANLTAVPTLNVATGTDLDTSLKGDASGTNSRTVTIEQTISSGTVTPTQKDFLRESYYQITVDPRFLSLSGKTPRAGVGLNQAIYECPGTAAEGATLSTITETFVRQSAGSSVPGVQNPSGNVSTVVSVRGMATGVSTTFTLIVNYSV